MVTINKHVTQHARIILTSLYKMADGVLVEMTIQQSLSMSGSLIMSAEVLGVLEEHGETQCIRHVMLFKV